MTQERRQVIHLMRMPGVYSEIWLDAQIRGTGRYESKAWCQYRGPEPSPWRSHPVHISDLHSVAETAVKLWRTDLLGGALRPFSSLPASIAHSSMKPEPTVFHAHFGPVGWSWLGLVKSFAAPLVVSFYGHDASKSQYKREPWVTRYGQLRERTSAILVEGPAMAERVASLGFPRSDIHVVRLPFTNVALAEIERSEPVWDVIMAGRFVEKKGFDVGLDAFASACATSGRMLVIGSGPLEESLRSQAHRLGIADRVTFIAPVPIEELARLIGASRCMLFPSRTAGNGDGEGGAPLTLTLAQFLGTPVIVTDHDDLPWTAAPNTPIVPPGDSAALSTQLDSLLLAIEEGRYAEQVAQARDFVNRMHNSTRLIAARETVYDQASVR